MIDRFPWWELKRFQQNCFNKSNTNWEGTEKIADRYIANFQTKLIKATTQLNLWLFFVLIYLLLNPAAQRE
jgi:hypothetical protein